MVVFAYLIVLALILGPPIASLIDTKTVPYRDLTPVQDPKATREGLEAMFGGMRNLNVSNNDSKNNDKKGEQ